MAGIRLRRLLPPWALLVALPISLGFTLFNRTDQSMRLPVSQPLVEVASWLVIAALVAGASRVRRVLDWVVAVIAGLLMAVMRITGRHYVEVDTPVDFMPFLPLRPSWPLEFALDWVAFAVGSVVALDVLSRSRSTFVRPVARWAAWLWAVVAFIVMLAAWCPYLLMLWPGILVRDSWTPLTIALGGQPMNNHHPVLFTLWVSACQAIARSWGGSVTAGVLLFAIVQAVVCALAWSAVAVWVRHRAGRWPAVATIAFFALSPAVAMWAITMHKDTMFVVWMTLLAVLLTEVSRRGLAWLARPWPLLGFAALLLAVSFSRNNGPHISAGVVGLLGLLALARLAKRRLIRARLVRARGRLAARGRRQWPVVLPAAVGVALLAAVMVVQGPVYRASGVVPGARAESVGLPLQQIAWATKYGRLTPVQAAEVTRLMPIDDLRANYNPTIVDTLKFNPEFRALWLNENSDEFMAMWRDVGRTNLDGYYLAWYALSGGYLDPDAWFVRFDMGTKRGSRDIVVLDRDLLGPMIGVENTKDAAVTGILRATAWPVVNLAYRMPVVVWACFLAAAAAVLRRRPIASLPFVPVLLCLATLLIASPITEFRYIAAAHFGLPVLLVCMWAGPRATTILERRVRTTTEG